MKRMFTLNVSTCLVAVVSVGASVHTVHAQGQPPPDHPVITVRGQTYTPRSILARNMGTPEDQNTAFPPHKLATSITSARGP